MSSLLNRLRKKVRTFLHRPEYVYLVMSLIGVISFVFITPPFQGPDEHAHYVRAQYIANGYLIPVNSESEGVGLPYSIDRVAEITFYNDDIRGDTNKKYNLHDTRAALGVPYNSEVQTKPIMVAYSPIPYLPATPFIALSNLLNLSPLVSMYLARLALGIVSILIFFFAIRLVPYKKYLFAIIGLIPMMLFQQAMITADSISYAILALFIAYILHLRFSVLSELTKKQWLCVGLLSSLIVLVKPLVFLFLPLILLLVHKKKAILWIVSIGVVSATLLIGWMMLVGLATANTESAADMTPSEVNNAEQAQVVRENPKRFARVMWNSYMTQYGDDETRGVIGVFGASDTIYPLWMFTIYAVILGIFAIISNDKRFRIPKKWQILALGISIAYFVAVNYALYTGYTPVNFDIVYGVQGRYFLPIVIASIVLLAGGVYIAKREFDKLLPRAFIVVFILILLALFITVQRYYLYTP